MNLAVVDELVTLLQQILATVLVLQVLNPEDQTLYLAARLKNAVGNVSMSGINHPPTMEVAVVATAANAANAIEIVTATATAKEIVNENAAIGSAILTAIVTASGRGSAKLTVTVTVPEMSTVKSV
jgi:hypothetical protein